MKLLRFFEFVESWDDVTVIEGLKRGNRRYENMFYNKYYPLLTKKVNNMTFKFDEDQVNQIVTNAIMRGIKKIDLYDFKGSLDGWMYRLVTNALYDFVKVNKKENRVSYVETVPDKSGGDSSKPAGDLKEEFKLFKKTITPKQRKIIDMYLNGYSHREIAEEMGVTEGTSKWHVNDILNLFKKFKQKLNK
jgi:RNA polymerase sigma factor (sigma-70 family)